MIFRNYTFCCLHSHGQGEIPFALPTTRCYNSVNSFMLGRIPCLLMTLALQQVFSFSLSVQPLLTSATQLSVYSKQTPVAAACIMPTLFSPVCYEDLHATEEQMREFLNWEGAIYSVCFHVAPLCLPKVKRLRCMSGRDPTPPVLRTTVIVRTTGGSAKILRLLKLKRQLTYLQI